MKWHRRVHLAVAIYTIVMMLCPFAGAQYGGGSGTTEDPYLIYTPEQMNAIGADPDDWDKHFRLMADIDLSVYTHAKFNIIASVPDPPSPRPLRRISAAGTTGAFTGVFDGDGHTISNLHYDSQDASYIGLFGRVDDPNASIKNLGLIDANISAETSRYVGPLVGCLEGGTIINCYAEGGTVRGKESVGGLVGGLQGSWGGDYPTLSCSHSSALVLGDENTGGLVGRNEGGAIANSRASGTVIGHTSTGGLVGAGYGSITNCYATATAIGTDWTGGLVGSAGGTITHCYATGAVIGDTYAGGLTGYYYPYPNDDIVGSFWDVDTTGQWDSGGGQDKTTAQMQTVGTYLKAGWDLAGETTNGTDDIWWLAEGQDYPRLWWEAEPGQEIGPYELPDLLMGAGTPDDPYLIHTAEELNLIGLFPGEWDKHYRLVADVDLHHYGADDLNLIGDPDASHPLDAKGTSFTGVFDGSGHVIRNFTWSTEDECCVGLFRRVAAFSAEIRDLGLITPHISAESNNRVGALVASLYDGTIRNCYVEGGAIAGGDFTGGLVGYHAYGAISECYSSAVVIGRYCTGGLAGRAGDYLKNCYGRGIVLGGMCTGGLTGDGGHLINCYSTSLVVGESTGGLTGGGDWRVTASFWDVETSGQPVGDRPDRCAGEGKTTAQMQDPNTFIAAGWDFFGPADGYADVWTMDPETGYPILWWQVPESDRFAPPAFSGGAGTADAPYLISSAEQLNSIHDNARLMVAHFMLARDIDLAGLDLVPIGSDASPFAGVFDGNWRAISNLTCISEDRSDVGIFGCIHGGRALVKNLGLIDPRIDVGTGAYAGALAGCIGAGRIRNCYVEGGSIVGDSHIGGLVGLNGSGTIGTSYTHTAVAGRQSVGGLVGRNVGDIMNCYSASRVMGDSGVGGLVGRNYFDHGGRDGNLSSRTYGTIANSYATGAVEGNALTGGAAGTSGDENLTACFWDVDTTGQSASRGGTGKTTAEMQIAATFLEAGWDFVDEVENGEEDIWWILEGQDYPRLWWELADEQEDDS